MKLKVFIYPENDVEHESEVKYNPGSRVFSKIIDLDNLDEAIKQDCVVLEQIAAEIKDNMFSWDYSIIED